MFSPAAFSEIAQVYLAFKIKVCLLIQFLRVIGAFCFCQSRSVVLALLLLLHGDLSNTANSIAYICVDFLFLHLERCVPNSSIVNYSTNDYYTDPQSRPTRARASPLAQPYIVLAFDTADYGRL